MGAIKKQRNFLKSDRWENFDKMETDQRANLPAPPVQKPYPENAALIDLIPPEGLGVGNTPLIEAIRARVSHRKYTDASLTLEELSFLLWATQGIREVSENGKFTKRTVPPGARVTASRPTCWQTAWTA